MLHWRRALTSKRCPQDLTFVANTLKLLPTESHQLHNVTNMTVAFPNYRSYWQILENSSKYFSSDGFLETPSHFSEFGWLFQKSIWVVARNSGIADRMKFPNDLGPNFHGWVFQTEKDRTKCICGRPIHKILFSFHINRNWNFRASWERIKEVNVMHMFELHPNSMQLNFLICPISSKNFSNSI